MKVKITDKNAVLKTAKTFMEEDINVEIDESLLGETVEEWDGSYTESDTDPDAPSGYTVTLEGTISISGVNQSYLKYQVNGGEVITTEGKTVPIVIEGVQSIVFTGATINRNINIGTTANGSDVGTIGYDGSVTYNPTSDITLYFSLSGGGAD